MRTHRESRRRRHLRLRGKVVGTRERPRFCVTRTLKHIHAQLIDDSAGVTLVSASTVDRDLRVQFKKAATGNKETAETIGRIIAERAKDKRITSVVFDRGGNLFHGRVKALAEAARQAGLRF